MITYGYNGISEKPTPNRIRVIVRKENRIYGNGEMRDWLESNCQHRFYNMPPWIENGIEFEDDRDAMMFALRWS